MNPVRLLALPFRYKMWRPLHVGLVWSDIRGISRQIERSHRKHLAATIGWLCRAQDVRPGGGVAAGWSFTDSWLPDYPETSGYIVETFIAASDVLAQPQLRERASRVLDWELGLQNADGSFPGHFGEPGSKPIIFNTGQIMHGMMAGLEHLGRQECLDAAVRAGSWMVAQQDDNGCWSHSVFNDIAHTYNTRAAWALLRAGRTSGEKRLMRAAVANVEWALTQQTESGWFETNAFKVNQAPFTHNIAYAIRGILECGLLIDEERYVASALRAAKKLAEAQRQNGWLSGTFDRQWRSTAYYSCLTGLAQMCVIWQRLDSALDEARFTAAVKRGLRFLKTNQVINGSGLPYDGGIAGSSPIWGRYSMFEYPNWAAKFFADALMVDGLIARVP